MAAIKRDIYLTVQRLQTVIDYTYGTDVLDIEFHIMDYDIPAGAMATAYSRGKSKKAKSIKCAVNGNVVSFTPKNKMFEIGENELQIEIIAQERYLYSFMAIVNCHFSFSDIASEDIGAMEDKLIEVINGTITEVSYKNVTSIPMYLFYRCSNLKTVSCPNVNTIETYAFAYCSSLDSIDLQNVESIGDSAFVGCDSIKEIDTAAKIYKQSFYGCDGLEKLKYRGTCLGNGTGETQCFYYCKNLSKVWISKNIDRIFAQYMLTAPFTYCESLTDIYLESDSTSSNFGPYWNYTGDGTQATVHYGVSEADFDAIMAAEEAAEQEE